MDFEDCFNYKKYEEDGLIDTQFLSMCIEDPPLIHRLSFNPGVSLEVDNEVLESLAQAVLGQNGISNKVETPISVAELANMYVNEIRMIKRRPNGDINSTISSSSEQVQASTSSSRNLTLVVNQHVRAKKPRSKKKVRSSKSSIVNNANGSTVASVDDHERKKKKKMGTFTSNTAPNVVRTCFAHKSFTLPKSIPHLYPVAWGTNRLAFFGPEPESEHSTIQPCLKLDADTAHHNTSPRKSMEYVLEKRSNVRILTLDDILG
ncbi:uncharacterized protein IL334_007972 [Kwoniella shivajii]|uniref:Uncharacterized protein n=1 Tax=Kwoniella shivajii TaxID=564305 RepID=A0ABZ1DA60_9TREE|nr:hypothetical protein IL334_007972 [Kwoniella shivajii]